MSSSSFVFSVTSARIQQVFRCSVVKGSIFLKKRNFIQESFKLCLYGIMIIRIKHLTGCKISVSLMFLNWIKKRNDFYRSSELMLAILIQNHDKESFHFYLVQGREIN